MPVMQFHHGQPEGTIQEMAPDTLAKRVRLRLEQLRPLGVSANRANDLAGFPSDGYVSRISTGARKKVDLGMLERLAAALRVRFDWLVRGVGDMDLPPDPAEAAKLPERALVALRVAVGRSKPVGETVAALAALARSCEAPSEVPTQDWLACVLGEPVSEPDSEDPEDSDVPPENPDIDATTMRLVYQDLKDAEKYGYPRELVRHVLADLRWHHKRPLTYRYVLSAAREDIDLTLERGEWPPKRSG